MVRVAGRSQVLVVTGFQELPAIQRKFELPKPAKRPEVFQLAESDSDDPDEEAATLTPQGSETIVFLIVFCL